MWSMVIVMYILLAYFSFFEGSRLAKGIIVGLGLAFIINVADTWLWNKYMGK